MLQRTTPENPHYQELVKALDQELAIRDGEDHDFYHQFNSSADIRHCIIAYADGVPVACGAIKAFDGTTMEIKRMYTKEAFRGMGYASAVLAALESWAGALGYKRCILETGINQPEAIALYQRCGYSRMPNYAQYAGVANSYCFEKTI